MTAHNNHTHCQAAQANTKHPSLAKIVSFQPHDQNDR